MKENTEDLPLEEKFNIIDVWTSKLQERKFATRLDRAVLKAALEACGANFEISPKLLKKLGREHFTNLARQKAMEAIWKERYMEFNDWTQDFISEYEAIPGRTLPNVAGRKNDGMIGFLGELTAYAAGNEETYPFAVFSIRVSARALEGYFRESLEMGEKEFRIHILVPGYNTIKYNFVDPKYPGEHTGELPFAPAGIPSDFAQEAWAKIKSWSK